jgi:hypothetical protein
LTKEGAEGGEAAEEAAASGSDDEDGEKIPTIQDRILSLADDNLGNDDAEILKAIFDIIKEK